MATQNLERDLQAVGNMIENITIAPNMYECVSPNEHTSRESMDANFLKRSVIETSNLERCVPQYSEVLTRTPDYGIKMEHLDLLQKDLETLLSKCVLRKILLLSETKPASEGSCNMRKNQGNKYQQKQQHLTKKLGKDKSFPKILKAVRPNTMASRVVVPHEVPSVNFSRNPVADDFWQFVESYCTNVTNNDLTFVESLIKESMQDIYVKTSAWNASSASCPLMQKNLANKEQLDKNFDSGNNLSREMEECVKELTAVRKKNLIALHKLRTAARKKISGQQKLATKDSSKQRPDVMLPHSKEE